MDYFQLFYTALGGLGIFFLGMRFLSESLQGLADSFIKTLISKITTNRLLAVGVGLLITTLVQSSSVTTVMVVGLVNAGLMSLVQAIGVILGSNIGTTITGWILAIKIGKYGLLLLGLGIFPMLFAKRSRYMTIGKIFVSLGLVFVGLETMSGAFKPLRSNEDFLYLMTILDAASLASVIGCAAVGCLLTFIVQSSSAMLGITIALASTGAITFPSAAALVLGENIGTTVTALLASVGTNKNARRAAASHALFNLTGVSIMILIFPYFVSTVDWMIPGNPETLGADGTKPFIAAHIAAGHTMFNVIAVLFMLPFVKRLAQLVTTLIPDGSQEAKTSLKYIRSTTGTSAVIAIQMASLELMEMARKVRKMLSHGRRFVRDKSENSLALDRVLYYEKVIDEHQRELTSYLCRVLEDELTLEQSEEVYSLIRAADELESVADHFESICLYRKRLFENKNDFSAEAWQQLHSYFDKTARFFVGAIEDNFAASELYSSEITERAKSLSILAEELKQKHLERMTRGSCSPESALTFSDIMVALRRVKNHTVNLAEAISYSSEFAEAS